MKTKTYIQVVQVITTSDETLQFMARQICGSDKEALASIQESGDFLFLPVHRVDVESDDQVQPGSRRNRQHGNQEEQ